MDNTPDTYTGILRQYWGYDSFRGIQREIIDSICQGNDTLGLMPTGGGKSITFQVPALALEGVCIVVTPLIALMKDQVQNLRKRGVMAAAIYSGMTRGEILATLENCILGSTKILYVSPERIASELFKTKLNHMRVSFITVDEAHCISQWGYDFRPSYLHIADIRKLKPDAPILALTATATPQVVDDIQQKLAFGRNNVFSMSFERKNLAYIVRQTTDKCTEMVKILRAVKGSAIIYVRSRRRSKEISQLLCDNGIESTFYHAGLEHTVKDERQKAWHDGDKRVMVATNAFGMGIDKSDVRMVIHIDCPSSIESYFQEAGRAGRDSRKAYAVLLFNDSDKTKLSKRIADEFPDKEHIRSIYEHLAYYYQIGVGSGCGHTFAFHIDDFCRTFKHFPVHADSALKILERAGYIEYETEPDTQPRLMFILNRNELYRLNDLAPMEDAVVTALLRNYGGLFTDYSYIDEPFMARQTGLTEQQVYLVLKSLSQRRILHFIPRRKTPYITYIRDRVDQELLVISSDVYEERREQFKKRIDAMVAYATNDDVCRSRQLLRYFGETRSADCHCCDVCIDHCRSNRSDTRIDAADSAIKSLLSDGKPHHISELHTLDISTPLLSEALSRMVAEEKIRQQNGFLSLP